MVKKEDLIKYLEDNKGCTNQEARKATYLFYQYSKSFLYVLIFFIIFYLIGLFKESIICFIGLKILRNNAGGIHIKSKIGCFIASFIMILTNILLGKYIQMNIYTEIILWGIYFILWYLYVPKGTSYVPIRDKTIIKEMKIKVLIFMCLIFITRFISPYLYQYLIFSIGIVFSLILPITYKITHTKEDRL